MVVVGGVESISKLQATLFDPLSPPPPLVFRHPPATFSRLLPSGKATPPLLCSPVSSRCLSFSFSLSLSGSLLFFSLVLSLAREATCSPRILISSKVLFPLNRAATRNNALYVRVAVASLFFPRFVARLFLPFSGHDILPLRVLPV